MQPLDACQTRCIVAALGSSHDPLAIARSKARVQTWRGRNLRWCGTSRCRLPGARPGTCPLGWTASRSAWPATKPTGCPRVFFAAARCQRAMPLSPPTHRLLLSGWKATPPTVASCSSVVGTIFPVLSSQTTIGPPAPGRFACRVHRDKQPAIRTQSAARDRTPARKSLQHRRGPPLQRSRVPDRDGLFAEDDQGLAIRAEGKIEDAVLRQPLPGCPDVVPCSRRTPSSSAVSAGATASHLPSGPGSEVEPSLCPVMPARSGTVRVFRRSSRLDQLTSGKGRFDDSQPRQRVGHPD